MKSGIMMALVLAGAMAWGGCASSSGPGGPTRFVVVSPAGGGGGASRSTTYEVQETDKIALLDKGVRQSVYIPSVLERVLEDGRMEVVANVKNRLNRRIEVQVSCVFKDETGFALNDEDTFRTLILTENIEEAARFVSLNDRARSYTIRIRQAR
ncbi:MAG: hypothetical protein KJ072_03945 [Verrucomicrobia bacterium]|nr:hypothetical protein [Verrucomicrobiota bacterium]